MKAFKEFRREDKSFWFFIRFISEKLGYSRKGIVLTYTVEQIEKLCENVSFYKTNLVKCLPLTEQKNYATQIERK